MKRRALVNCVIVAALGGIGASVDLSGSNRAEAGDRAVRGARAEVPEGMYVIVAAHSGLPLNIPGALKHQGRMVAQGGPIRDTLYDHMKWRFTKVGSHYRIQAYGSGLYLEVAEGWTFDGAPAVQWAQRDVDHQLFSFRDAGNGNVRIVAKHSGKCLEIIGGWKTPSAALVQWSAGDRPQQIFKLQSVPAKP